jgi:tetratricopeptide (TPR) repeat protein
LASEISDKLPVRATRGRFNSGCGCISKLAAILLLCIGAYAETAASLNAEGSRALTAGDVVTALAKFRSAARLDPSDLQIQLNLGLALIRAGQLRDAIAPLENAARDTALAGEAHMLLGAGYFESRQYEKTITELKDLQDSAQQDRVLYMLEESYRLTGQKADARDAFRQINGRFPDSAWTHFLLGSAYESQQQPEKAIAEYRQVIAIDPSIPNARFAIGYLCWRQQDPEQARMWLEAEAHRGCHSLANYYLGEIARGDKDTARAETLYERAIACDPSNGDAHLRLGSILTDQKRYREAMIELKKAVDLAPGQSAPHYHLGTLYRQMGRKSDAEAEYRKVREIHAASDNGVDVTGDAKP